ncbi:MAG TPA: hypothetical protein VGF64_02150, partial [Acidimicrobiales bacterium]
MLSSMGRRPTYPNPADLTAKELAVIGMVTVNCAALEQCVYYTLVTMTKAYAAGHELVAGQSVAWMLDRLERIV